MFLKIYKQIWFASHRFDEKSKKNVIAIVVLVTLVSLIDSVLPYMIKLIVDRTQDNQNIHYIYLLVISYCFAWLLSQILEWTKNVLTGLVSSKLGSSILILALENYLKIEKSQQDKVDIGVFNSDAMRASNAFAQLTLSLLLVFFPIVFQLIFITCILYVNIDPLFALGFIAMALFIFLVTNVINRESKKYYEPLYSVRNTLNSKFLEKVSHYYEIKANHSIEFEVDGFKRKVKNHVDQTFHSHYKIGQLMVFQIFLIFIFLIIFWLISTKLFELDQITSGDMVMISSYIMMLTMPFLMISQQINLIAGHIVAIKKFSDYLNMPKEEVGSEKFQDQRSLFSFHQAVVEVGGRVKQAFDLSFDKGKVYAIIGQTGSGKSTLINYLLGFYKIKSGQLRYKNLDISQLYSKYIFEEIAFVGQNYSVFTGSLRENLIYNSRYTYQDDEIYLLLDLFGLQDAILDKNLSLDDDINEYLKSFSGGEKQRLNILRAVLKKPKLLILDEPTSALDSNTALKIIIFLKSHVETLIMITHSRECIKLADEIIDVEQLFQDG
ncbi:ABC transporter ATP-binding protein/permease [Acinetobacter sp. NIPH1876]|uniref:ATP-binding cassette domain-containing protein n=1 Tax=Acinetobacter sp. NIPH1876 TaxID=2924041 RepID=UPI001FAC0329|nr:ABC transporter ATP-binding protein [Acinetobacter sp. NIPH1876]MCJ0829398.1 ABC transporter ATP-binding protein/permease [Acinetobacter sp. NIPH1876]